MIRESLKRLCRHIVMTVVILGLTLNVMADHFRHLNLSDGLSQPSVMAIFQDRLGRMWFGTREGVNVYDGTSMRTYKGWIKDSATGNNLWVGNKVNSIVEDSEGNIFILIDSNIVKFDIKAERFAPLTASSSVRSLASYDGSVAYISGDSIFLKEGDIFRFEFMLPQHHRINSIGLTKNEYMASASDGLLCYDRKTHKQRKLLDGKEVNSSYESKDGTLWICTQNEGLYRLDQRDNIPQLVSVPKTSKGVLGAKQTRNAIDDQRGRIWYGSFSGLSCYDPLTGNTDHIEIPANVGGLSHSSIYGLYRDRQGTIWVGSYYGGVNYFSPDYDRFYNFDFDRVAPKDLFHSLISDFVTDRYGNLWFSTDGAGVCCVDSTWHIVTHLSTKSGHLALRQNNIKALQYDSIGNRVFIGTHLGGLSYYDIDRRHTVNLIDKGLDKIPGDVIHDLHINGDYLYVSSRKGLSRMNLRTGDFSQLNNLQPRKLDSDKDGNIYFLDQNKTYRMTPPSGNTESPKLSVLAGGIEYPSSILSTDSAIYVGTFGNGLFIIPIDKGKVKHLDTHDSNLPSDYCYALQKGKDGEIFIATDGRVVKLNPDSFSVASVEFSELFPESHLIADCAFMSRPDGNLLVGSTHGITIINEENFMMPVRTGEELPDFFLSHLNVMNKEVSAGDGSGVLSCALPFASEIRLKPDQNSFSITIGSGDHISNRNASQFQYRLDGVDKHWLAADNGTIRYTNLSPGKYTLKVRRDSSTGIDSERIIELKVIVEHPWYSTWWAMLMYLVIVGIAIWIVYVKARDHNQLKQSLKKEKNEREQIEKLNHEKLVFFTNVSHEFQTPLTLITSHIDLLLSKLDRNEKLSAPLKRIRIHAEQMSHLITQLLEFRKLQQNHQAIRIGCHDAAEVLRKTASPFIEHAERRNISFRIVAPDSGVSGYFDPCLLERVIVNLISNAFKYTPDGGKIECGIEKDRDRNLVIWCADNGKGISEEDLPFIFDRFYNGSVDEIKYNDLHYKSTGIGLAFAKSIVDRHHGQLTVKSRPGDGSVFTVTLPGNKDVFDGDGNVVFDYSLQDNISTEAPVYHTLPTYPDHPDAIAEDTDNESITDKETLLIIEDNHELRHNLSVFFSVYFDVVTASDGADGIEKAKEINPDIIISDVLMPRMSGTELCRRIKSDIELCHIPVILLTALSSTESQLDGLNANADDYVTKPFDSSVLLARVDNLLRIRKLLRSQYDKKFVSEIDTTGINPLDRDLLKRVSDFIEKHISNPDLDIPFLCTELGISRSTFYNKFKSLTGMTPSAFILNHRLKRAAMLLKEYQHLRVTEIAEQTGFSTTDYFSRCFKKQFGVAPQKYRNSSTSDEE